MTQVPVCVVNILLLYYINFINRLQKTCWCRYGRNIVNCAVKGGEQSNNNHTKHIHTYQVVNCNCSQ